MEHKAVKRMIRSVCVMSAFLVALTASAIAQNAPTGKTPGALTPLQPQRFPVNVQWQLVSFAGKPKGSAEPTLFLDQQLRMRGFSGCNTFSATAYPVKNQGFAVGPIATTRKECDKAMMDFERAYLIALRTSVQWQIKDGYLYLNGQMGELKFERALF